MKNKYLPVAGQSSPCVSIQENPVHPMKNLPIKQYLARIAAVFMLLVSMFISQAANATSILILNTYNSGLEIPYYKNLMETIESEFINYSGATVDVNRSILFAGTMTPSTFTSSSGAPTISDISIASRTKSMASLGVIVFKSF